MMDQITSAAEQAGREAGRAAGTWVFDGNTEDATVRRVLQGYEDGDPETMDMLPAPLSGEWAGESIPEIIYGALGRGWDELTDEEFYGFLSAYEAGYADGYWAEVQRSGQATMTGEEDEELIPDTYYQSADRKFDYRP